MKKRNVYLVCTSRFDERGNLRYSRVDSVCGSRSTALLLFDVVKGYWLSSHAPVNVEGCEEDAYHIRRERLILKDEKGLCVGMVIVFVTCRNLY